MALAAPASPSRRAVLGALGATLAAPAALAVGNELDPADVVPRRFSQGAFLSLDANRIYDLRYASRLSRRIIIDGFTASMSHHVIAMAAAGLAGGPSPGAGHARTDRTAPDRATGGRTRGRGTPRRGLSGCRPGLAARTGAGHALTAAHARPASASTCAQTSGSSVTGSPSRRPCPGIRAPASRATPAAT